MGLLAVGTPLEWPETKKVAAHVREWGIEQLLAVWRRAKGKERDALLWGDEIEYLVVTLDEENRKVKLSLRQADILHALAEDEKLLALGGGVPDLNEGADKTGETAPTYHPEFGRFMLEATPGKPWGIGFQDLLDVEKNMKWRRKIAKDHMEPGEYPITLTTFPRLGLPNTLSPEFPVSGPKLRSQFLPDEIANPHIRFPTLAANIRSRRGRKVEINVPVYRDTATIWPFQDPTVNYNMHQWPEDDDVRNGAAKENHVYMDAMAFGMGSCCLQITFQAKNIDEGRKMYDQLSPLGPILLALTAATPVYKGFLVDTDVRWDQISRAVDDRTVEELGEKPLKNDRWRIPKSRYASNSTYISSDPRLRKEYFEPELIVDEEMKARLMAGGMDDLLATHFAHLFIRDPLVVFAEDLQELDLSKSDHFENLQSTNWQHMRFKPPPPPKMKKGNADEMIPLPADSTANNDGGAETINSTHANGTTTPNSSSSSTDDVDDPNVPGWRVEFRSMEIQPTDFENAAFAIFIVLITRAILSFDLNFYIPIPRTTENMETAHRRDAVLNDSFWFRKDPFPPRRPNRGTPSSSRAPSRPSTPGPGASRSGFGGSHDSLLNHSHTNGHIHPITHSLAHLHQQQQLQQQQLNFGPVEDEYRKMSINEIINGTAACASTSSNPAAETSPLPNFPGLIPLVESYLDSINITISTRCELARYLELIRKRAAGELKTPARWIREYIGRHEEYKNDSVVGEGVTFELCRIAELLGCGQLGKVPRVEELLGKM